MPNPRISTSTLDADASYLRDGRRANEVRLLRLARVPSGAHALLGGPANPD